jgi:hypothetical protein
MNRATGRKAGSFMGNLFTPLILTATLKDLFLMI